MGAYLSTPNTEKFSADGITETMSYGASSMQGWRMSQEDAHNCIPDFEGNNTSFFAVYDGHGGAEVAEYCALHFPDYIKNFEKYKKGMLQEALVEAFLGFDNFLLKEDVLKELKVMAGLDDEEEEPPKKIGKSEAEMLRAEADMPIEELLAQYEGCVPLPQEIKNLRKKKNILSPLIKSKRPQFPNEAADGEDDSFEKEILKPCNPNASATVTSHSMSMEENLANSANGHAENENNLNREKEQNEILQKQSLQQQEGESKSCTVSSVECDSGVKVDESAAVKGETTPAQCEKMDSEVCSSSSSSSSAAATCSSSSSSSTSGQCSSNVVQNSSVSSSDNSTRDTEAAEQTCGQETGVLRSSEADSTSGEIDSCTKVNRDSDAGPSGSSVESSQSDVCVQSSSSNPCVDMGPSSSGSAEEAQSSSSQNLSTKATNSEEDEREEGELESEDLLDEDDDGDDDSDDEYEDIDSESEDDSEESEEEDEDVDIPFANGSDPANDEPGFCSGCTAVVALIRNKDVVVANAGDSRCVLCRGGKAVDMSFDHKPEDDIERKRINAAGGAVTNDGRVNGGLNLSRAIGDHFYKRNESKSDREQMITALPDLETTTLQEGDEFLVLACDGIWYICFTIFYTRHMNYMTSQEVVDFVKERLKDPEKKKKLSLICEEMFDYCLAPNTVGDGTGCDNMTCIIVTFEQMFNNNKNKRDCSQMQTSDSSADEVQPEKRAKIEESASSET